MAQEGDSPRLHQVNAKADLPDAPGVGLYCTWRRLLAARVATACRDVPPCKVCESG